MQVSKKLIRAVLICVAVQILFIYAAAKCAAQGNEVNCNWTLSADTLKFKYMSYIDDEGKEPTIRTVKNNFVVAVSEKLICPQMRALSERRKRIIYNGKEIIPLFIEQ